MNSANRKRPQGEIRQGQLITTFGPGAMTDLPERSVLVSGLDFWFGERTVISEPRLAAKIATLLQVPEVRLESPPASGDVDDARPSGVPVFRFPEWFVTQDSPGLFAGSGRRTRYLVHLRALVKGNRFIDPDTGNKLKVVPVRFVRACRRGHIGDIDWYFFLHGTDNQCRNQGRLLFLRDALDGVTDAEVWAEIQARRGALTGQQKSVKGAELETLLATADEIGEDRPEGVFYARTLPKAEWDRPWMSGIERVVLVPRLREVMALVGFTRFEAAAPDTEGELDMGVRRAELARDLSWVPAVENKGEGVFLQFRNSAIEEWLRRETVLPRILQLKRGFEAWKAEHSASRREFPHPAYILLHSFSHLLITAVALECGYPASSIRERVYALPQIGYGVLLYTGSSDAEGTLGGLIEVGRRIASSIRGALELGRLCSNDPVCAQHAAESLHERRFLQGAACHGCLLLAETSCEQQNDLLDRSLVVRTVQGDGAEFFRESES